MAARKTAKGKLYSEARVNAILKAGSRRLGGPRGRKKNCWRVDLKTLVIAALHLAGEGKTEMRFFVTEGVPRKTGKVIDPTKHMLFIETGSACMEEFPPGIMP